MADIQIDDGCMNRTAVTTAAVTDPDRSGYKFRVDGPYQASQDLDATEAAALEMNSNLDL